MRITPSPSTDSFSSGPPLLAPDALHHLRDMAVCPVEWLAFCVQYYAIADSRRSIDRTHRSLLPARPRFLGGTGGKVKLYNLRRRRQRIEVLVSAPGLIMLPVACIGAQRCRRLARRA
jgi:hypothetical protein